MLVEADESPVRMRLAEGEGSGETVRVWRAPREERPRKAPARRAAGAGP